MRVGFRADATAMMGGGHVMRCLTLADALMERGCQTAFVAASLPDWLRARLVEAGHEVHVIADDATGSEASAGWESRQWAPGAQRRDAERTSAAFAGAVDWMVVDHYLLDRHWEEAVRPFAARILVLDDLANRRHACDLLLDQTFGRAAADYAAWTSRETPLLLGPVYALLRPEFARERPVSLARRRSAQSVRNILISLGATDVGGFTLPATEAALIAAPNSEVHVVTGRDAPCLPALVERAAKQDRVHLHIDSNEMARLMRDADLAIGASGSTSWERCCLGLPTVALVLADNQRFLSAQLEAVAAAMIAEGTDALREQLAGLIANQKQRFAMTAAAAALADGQGVRRVVNVMLEPSASCANGALHVRPADLDDAEPLWLWRNDPATRQASRTADPIAWPEHAAWLERTLDDPDRRLLIVECGDEPVGMVRFDRVAGDRAAHEVSINVRPDARGGGTGRAVLAAGCRYFLEGEGPVRLLASVHGTNRASVRIFEALGFSYAEPVGQSGFDLYVRPEDAPVGEL